MLVDFKDLVQNQQVCAALPDLTNQLREQPETTLNCLGLAIHQVHTHTHTYTHTHTLTHTCAVAGHGVFQVLTADLERHAAELQGEGLPRGATHIINIPHISAR